MALPFVLVLLEHVYHFDTQIFSVFVNSIMISIVIVMIIILIIIQNVI